MRRIAIAVLVAASCSSSSPSNSNGLVGGVPTAGRGPMVPPGLVDVDAGAAQVDGPAAAPAPDAPASSGDTARPPDVAAAAPVDGPSAAQRPDAAAADAAPAVDVRPPRPDGYAGPDGRYTCKLCCGATKQWTPTGLYKRGEDVVNIGHLFYCHGDPAQPFLDNCNGAALEPGRADTPAWTVFWEHVGICAVPAPPPSQCTMCVN